MTALLIVTNLREVGAVAESTLAKLFPGRRIIPIDCTELIWGLGAFHCLTQQQPAVAP